MNIYNKPPLNILSRTVSHKARCRSRLSAWQSAGSVKLGGTVRDVVPGGDCRARKPPRRVLRSFVIMQISDVDLWHVLRNEHGAFKYSHELKF